jgi:hypothetical protein
MDGHRAWGIGFVHVSFGIAIGGFPTEYFCRDALKKIDDQYRLLDQANRNGRFAGNSLIRAQIVGQVK